MRSQLIRCSTNFIAALGKPPSTCSSSSGSQATQMQQCWSLHSCVALLNRTPSTHQAQLCNIGAASYSLKSQEALLSYSLMFQPKRHSVIPLHYPVLYHRLFLIPAHCALDVCQVLKSCSKLMDPRAPQKCCISKIYSHQVVIVSVNHGIGSLDNQ